MDDFRELLACPACAAPLAKDWSCRGCGERFDAPDGIPNLRLPGDERTDAVHRFYKHAPFPGYPPRDSLQALHARAGRSVFAHLVNQAIPGDARIVEIGCGTGQMCLYLARADRVVIGADLTRAALRLGAAAAQRFGLDRVQFVETDLRRPGLKAGSFDVVYSSGVVHHTPNPRASFARLVQLARPGGVIVLGVYNTLARIPLRIRRLVARLSGFRVVPFDPVLRDRRNEPARRQAWLRDQYQHPEEHRHTLQRYRMVRRESSQYLRVPERVLARPGDVLARRRQLASRRPAGAPGWIARSGTRGSSSRSAGACSAGLSLRRKSQKHVPRCAVSECVARAREYHAAGDGGSRRSHRTASGLDAVHRLEVVQRVVFPQRMTVAGRERAQHPVLSARKDDSRNHGEGGRLATALTRSFRHFDRCEPFLLAGPEIH